MRDFHTYRDIAIFYASLFDKVATGSTYLILAHRVLHKDTHKFFLGR